MMDDRIYEYWLANVYGIKTGTGSKVKLIDVFGSAREIYFASEQLIKTAGIITDDSVCALIESRNHWELEAKWDEFLKTNVGFVSVEDELYPDILRSIPQSPYALYYLGELPKIYDRNIAIVGARRCSAYGKCMADDLAYKLARRGYTIVSGMANGIDSESHKGALRGGEKTIAVLGCGPDVIYPPNNNNLHHEIVENGCVISEYPPGTQPMPELFPQRNRIISGLSSTVIIIEAKERSGSLITADFALSQGKDVFALPGRVTDTMSLGCNNLIKQGAGIINNIEDFLRDLDEVNINSYVECENTQNIFNLEKDELLVYSCLDFYPKGIEQLQEDTQLNLLCLLSALLNLCGINLAKECFMNQYVKLR